MAKTKMFFSVSVKEEMIQKAKKHTLFEEMRCIAKEGGISDMSLEEINHEISETRKQRVNTDLMTSDEIHSAIKEGYDDALAGNVQDASLAFEKFRKEHQY